MTAAVRSGFASRVGPTLPEHAQPHRWSEPVAPDDDEVSAIGARHRRDDAARLVNVHTVAHAEP
jgi:hypothetical protein